MYVVHTFLFRYRLHKLLQFQERNAHFSVSVSAAQVAAVPKGITHTFLFRYLLRKLLQFQSATDGAAPLSTPDSHLAAGIKSGKSPAGHSTTPEHTLDSAAKKSGAKKRAVAAGVGSSGESKKKMQSQAAKDLLGERPACLPSLLSVLLRVCV